MRVKILNFSLMFTQRSVKLPFWVLRTLNIHDEFEPPSLPWKNQISDLQNQIKNLEEKLQFAQVQFSLIHMFLL
jgi:hypothetical protein